MVDTFPEEIVYHLSGFIQYEDFSNIIYVNRQLYEYFQPLLLSYWKKRGRSLINYVNNEKLTINRENIIHEWVFFPISLGTYRTRLNGEMHDHLFISIDKYIGKNFDYENRKKAIVQDENGNIMRGLVEYEIIV